VLWSSHLATFLNLKNIDTGLVPDCCRTNYQLCLFLSPLCFAGPQGFKARSDPPDLVHIISPFDILIKKSMAAQPLLTAQCSPFFCPYLSLHTPIISAPIYMSTSTESPVLAGPPGDCCTKGVKHFGNPVGKVITIADVPTYLSEPPANVHSEGPKKVVLFFADIFGPLYVNARLLQDYYASHGAFLAVSEDIYLFR
jgi:hypothetical protein